MKVVVDREEWAVALAAEATIADAMRDVMTRLGANRRWVTGTRLDGAALKVEGPDEVRTRRCSDYVCLEVDSLPALEILTPLMDSVTQLLGTLRKAHDRAGGDIAVGRGPAGLRALLDCLMGWKMVTQFIAQVARAASSPTSGLRMPTGEMQKRVQGLNATLTELKGALETKDLSLAGDLLTHDLVGHLDFWDSFLKTLRATAERDLAPPPDAE